MARIVVRPTELEPQPVPPPVRGRSSVNAAARGPKEMIYDVARHTRLA